MKALQRHLGLLGILVLVTFMSHLILYSPSMNESQSELDHTKHQFKDEHSEQHNHKQETASNGQTEAEDSEGDDGVEEEAEGPVASNPHCKCKMHFTPKTISCEGSTKTLVNYDHHICPQTFRSFADYVFQWPNSMVQEWNYTAVDDPAVWDHVPEGSIIYVMHRYGPMRAFFNDIYPRIKNNFVLITGEGDQSWPDRHIDLVTNPSKIIWWFGQNGVVPPEHRGKIRFTQIPIGLNCFQHSNFIDEIFRMNAHETIEPTKQILVNFMPKTDKTGLRQAAWDFFCNETTNPMYNSTGCIPKARGVMRYFDEFVDIYKRNLAFRFWISPRGNGWDCHRTWEALYMKRIPVVQSGPLDPMLEGLPLMTVHDYSALTQEDLDAFMEEYQAKMGANEYKLEKLTPQYWKNLILSHSRHKYTGMDDTKRDPRCWGVLE